MNLTYKLILTFFSIGYIKYAPGSVASFLLMLIWFLIPNILILHLVLFFFILFLSIYSCYWYSINSNAKDPSYIVIDEVLGMSLSLILLPKELSLYMFAFLLFRVFDILKPSIIYNVQDLEYGIGILADDILAGLFTFVVIWSMILI